MDFNAVVQRDQQDQDQGRGALPPMQASPLDLDAARESLEVYSEAVEKMLIQAEAHQVSDKGSHNQAIAMAGEVKKLNKTVEVKRKEITADARDFVKQINALCKSWTDPLAEAEKILKNRAATYQHQIELERRKQEERARQEHEALQQKLQAEAKEAGVEAPEMAPPAPVIPEQKVYRSESGASLHTRKRWVAELEDPDLIPREYCSPDQKKLDQAVKMGVRDIPGVRIYEKIDGVLRS